MSRLSRMYSRLPGARTRSHGGLRWWDTASGEPLHLLEGHSAPIVNAQFSAAGDLLASAAFDGTVRLWGVAAAPA